jgi:hypothetical protein
MSSRLREGSVWFILQTMGSFRDGEQQGMMQYLDSDLELSCISFLVYSVYYVRTRKNL